MERTAHLLISWSKEISKYHQYRVIDQIKKNARSHKVPKGTHVFTVSFWIFKLNPIFSPLEICWINLNNWDFKKFSSERHQNCGKKAVKLENSNKRGKTRDQGCTSYPESKKLKQLHFNLLSVNLTMGFTRSLEKWMLRGYREFF